MYFFMSFQKKNNSKDYPSCINFHKMCFPKSESDFPACVLFESKLGRAWNDSGSVQPSCLSASVCALIDPHRNNLFLQQRG